MSIWAIADLHLSFGTPNKKMDVFGPRWANHEERLAKHWQECISPNDLVLLPGDISWAMHMDQALQDLEWIAKLPGTKLMIRGNHDYWWGSISKVRKHLPPSIHAIQNDSFTWNEIAIGGSRLWDSSEFSCSELFEMTDGPLISGTDKDGERIYQRELRRLEMSLKTLDSEAKYRIAMTHYPPIGPQLEASSTSELMDKYKIDICVFGHLHNVLSSKKTPFGKRSQTEYRLTSCDHLECQPLCILNE